VLYDEGSALLPYADKPMDEKYFFCECGEVGCLLSVIGPPIVAVWAVSSCPSWATGPRDTIELPASRIFGNYTRGPVEPTVFENQL
jgi:hypothetical protein